MIKKILCPLFILLISTQFISCSWSITPKHVLPYAYGYKWEEKDFYDQIGLIRIRKDSTIDEDGLVTVIEDSGKGDGARNNLSCYNLGMKENSTGISIDVYCNQNMSSAGIQWWENKGMSSQRFYWIYFDRHGNFNIHKKDIDPETKKTKEIGIKWTPAKNTNINPEQFNNITTCINKSGDMDIYTNGKLFYTIKKDDLMYSEGKFFIVMCSDPKITYSKEKLGVAQFKLVAEQSKSKY